MDYVVLVVSSDRCASKRDGKLIMLDGFGEAQGTLAARRRLRCRVVGVVRIECCSKW